MISVLFLILGYLIGSINFSIIFTHIFSNTDVRDHGSGNAGFTNTLRVSGKKVATLVFVCDAAKAAFAIVLAILYAKYAGNYDAHITADILLPWALYWGTISRCIIILRAERELLFPLLLFSVLTGLQDVLY